LALQELKKLRHGGSIQLLRADFGRHCPKAEPKMGIDKGGVVENKQHLYLHIYTIMFFGVFLVEGLLKQ